MKSTTGVQHMVQISRFVLSVELGHWCVNLFRRMWFYWSCHNSTEMHPIWRSFQVTDVKLLTSKMDQIIYTVPRF